MGNNKQLVNITIQELVRQVIGGDDSAVLADYLEDRNHPEASVIRALTSPAEIVCTLLGECISPTLIFELPISEIEKLDLVLRQASLDDAVLFELGCDFAEHVLPIFEAWNEFDTRPHDALETMRRWIYGRASDDELRNAHREIKYSGTDSSAGYAMWAAMTATNPWAWAKHCVAGWIAFDTAERARRAAGEQEMKWQLERCASVLASI